MIYLFIPKQMALTVKHRHRIITGIWEDWRCGMQTKHGTLGVQLY